MSGVRTTAQERSAMMAGHCCISFKSHGQENHLALVMADENDSNIRQDYWNLISFYKFYDEEDPDAFAERLIGAWAPMNVVGRVYVATEGINAQLAVPASLVPLFRNTIKSTDKLQDVWLNVDVVVPHAQKPFEKLTVKHRKQVLSDGLGFPLDINNNGNKLTPAAPLLLDIRNIYEYEIGRFQSATPVPTSTFKETWQILDDLLQNENKDREILTYCTGGIRCEKANAYIVQKLGSVRKQYRNFPLSSGQGGIVHYSKFLRETNQRYHYTCLNSLSLTPFVACSSKFLGVNHVFDQRCGTQVGGQRIGQESMRGCCSSECLQALSALEERDGAEKRLAIVKSTLNKTAAGESCANHVRKESLSSELLTEVKNALDESKIKLDAALCEARAAEEDQQLLPWPHGKKTTSTSASQHNLH
ncbi:hypothetical protein GUITHDRAFT_149366 [Guillardia theta CCMP2712]|uniref:Rhodanese domain-containing protein n=1 Tax=Guillardia theta (strain CCMP2712) TaxID=905079 RepID=L1I545_GUITC|nr:hypothetical protein GUITHDRAFT_149366 [Guillardia theta CCMP2712]EKX31341.1 hypothetical protein GUITHDRAFT_149366 [Guillardia theta CCMP2712]|eukprot:XP_005818321.1 hypothetical protein GUITHDRAFT_149366 [Guillardia theta CCMP2712]